MISIKGTSTKLTNGAYGELHDYAHAADLDPQEAALQGNMSVFIDLTSAA